jgi:4'-phosphopantetheinyl transferase
MPLIINKNINEYVQLGVWEITEDTDFFLSQVILTENEKNVFDSLRSDTRKKQWLSYRLTIKRLLNIPQVLDIVYDSQGRPRILKHNYRVSVSHSGKYAAAVVSKRYQVGIDIEKVHPRIEKVIYKFLNKKELNDLDYDPSIEHMNVCWSAKEALYKLVGRKQLSFISDIQLDSFIYIESGSFNASINYLDSVRKVKVYYEELRDYILVYAVEE